MNIKVELELLQCTIVKPRPLRVGIRKLQIKPTLK